MRSITRSGIISSDIIDALGFACPQLSNLTVDLVRSNVSALVTLLTSRCYKLQSLTVQYNKESTSVSPLARPSGRA